MIGIAHRASATTIERARRLYTGIDPDTRAKLTPSDAHRMTGLAIALALDVHPHTVDGWIQRFAWSRPAWYRKASPRFSTRPTAVPPKLRAAIEAAVTKGEPLPDNWRLARTFGCSLQAVSHALRIMRRAGEVRVERNGPSRRLVLKDGRATGWTELPRGGAPSPRSGIGIAVERRSRAELLLEALAAWANEQRPMPSDVEGGELFGCNPSTFRKTLKLLRDTGKVTMENRPSRRRCRLSDGRATAWSVPQVRHKAGVKPPAKSSRRARGAAPLDLVADEAVRSLRRQGPVVFDLSVATDCAPGVAWSVDGKTMTRAELLAEAVRRNARAIERLVSGAEGVAP
ncbi:hypothetical protein [uncultured Reyranella sp.]|uniref:hypothetical protein n=1 Tax=uncultured Reyranella sp. TaxID=735512 RepID=UPI00259D2572|nr:hypothetical protein [uncultured Reyranella sp.]